MTRLEFLKTNAPWLGAGGLLTFGSSFGQTYFISIYAGEIRGEFGLSHAEWGSIYALGTSVSAVMMLVLGGMADRFRTRDMALVVVAGLAAMCLAMAFVPSAGLLPLVILGLRFCGQGMMSHMAVVSISRWFAKARGRAISFVHMGFSVGEATLPVVYVFGMGLVGWRVSWMIAAANVALFIPVLMYLLREERSPQSTTEAEHTAGMMGRFWTRSTALKHWLFWITLPGFLTQPIFSTAFFFQQVHLTEVKGWQLEAFVSLIPLYTIASLTALFVGGVLVDRLGTRRLLPVYLLPMAIGFSTVAIAPNLWVAALGLILMGFTQGTSAATVGAYWPEHYGTRHLGAIRSVAMAVMVLASALGPLITGVLIDAGIDYRWQLAGMSAYAITVSLINFVAMARINRAPA